MNNNDENIIFLKGGLGNQMFQVIFGYRVLKEFKKQITFKNNLNTFKYELDNLNLTAPVVKKKGNSKVLIYIIRLMNLIFNSKYFYERSRTYINFKDLKKYKLFDGYWQSYKYVEKFKIKELRKFFFPKYLQSKYSNYFEGTPKDVNKVFVGVRRGDYLKNIKHYGSLDPDFFYNAMLMLEDKIGYCEFHIFSNDIEWCVKNLNFKKFKIKFRENKSFVNSLEELYIMSNFEHAIISNSTFHWWAAYLIKNKSKIVIAPEKWFVDDKKIDILPPNWIKIER